MDLSADSMRSASANSIPPTHFDSRHLSVNISQSYGKRSKAMRLILVLVCVGVSAADIAPTNDPMKPREYSALIFKRPSAVTYTMEETPKNPLECDSKYCGKQVCTGYIRRPANKIIQEIR